MRVKLPTQPWINGLIGAGLAVTVGFLIAWTRLAGGLVFLSYDLPFFFKNASPPQDLILIYLDEESYQALGQNPTRFDRAKHAEVLDVLAAAGTRLVVYDFWFGDRLEGEAGSEESDEALVQAIQGHGRVLLAAILDASAKPGIRGATVRLPDPRFVEAAAGWGIAEVIGQGRSVIRQYYQGDTHGPSLPEQAARFNGSGLEKREAPNRNNPWLNYYGPAQIFSHVSFSEVALQEPEVFRDKVVFVGTYPFTPYAFDETDEFISPYSRWGEAFYPGVALAATAYLNWKNNDWLHRVPVFWELTGLLCLGFALGYGLTLLRPGIALLVAALAIGIMAAVGCFLPLQQHLWFPWTATAFGQAPVALGWALFSHYRKLMELKRGVPDHTLLAVVGRGAYGEVWLARNEIGLFHAVKIIYRKEFDDEIPYLREFNGMQKFMPISRSHPGFVNILHVGRNDKDGYFFYIMEAADDVTSGPTILPEKYVPKTLARELERKGSLVMADALALMLQLTEALEQLHQHQLIHRDIKPANIIYVNGSAKFADIGLVTEMATTSRDVTAVGTAGYIAPEGPGTPAADVYSLGKVFYEVLTGQDPHLFPEMPTRMMESMSDPNLTAANQVIGKACDNSVERRYTTAAEMLVALKALF